ncbi:hypothetical protein BFJ71_g6062 [Fusarium oxysporum]|nr:hypothetical protein BFJ71_g6062 [Fusarium oxysporum]
MARLPNRSNHLFLLFHKFTDETTERSFVRPELRDIRAPRDSQYFI